MASAPMWSSLEAKSSSQDAYCRTTWGLFGRLHSNLWTQRWFRCWATLNIVVRQQLSKAILHSSCHLSHRCLFKHTKVKRGMTHLLLLNVAKRYSTTMSRNSKKLFKINGTFRQNQYA
jgi:hypothetical protein